MKHAGGLLLAVAVVGISAPVFAQDIKVFPGAMCHPARVSADHIDDIALQVYDGRAVGMNPVDSTIVCPVVRDDATSTTTPMWTSLQLFGYRSSVESWSCTAYVWESDLDSYTDDNPIGAGTGSFVAWFNAPTPPWDTTASITIVCDNLPNGGSAMVVSYRITEYLPTD